MAQHMERTKGCVERNGRLLSFSAGPEEEKKKDAERESRTVAAFAKSDNAISTHHYRLEKGTLAFTEPDHRWGPWGIARCLVCHCRVLGPQLVAWKSQSRHALEKTVWARRLENARKCQLCGLPVHECRCLDKFCRCLRDERHGIVPSQKIKKRTNPGKYPKCWRCLPPR